MKSKWMKLTVFSFLALVFGLTIIACIYYCKVYHITTKQWANSVCFVLMLFFIIGKIQEKIVKAKQGDKKRLG